MPKYNSDDPAKIVWRLLNKQRQAITVTRPSSAGGGVGGGGGGGGVSGMTNPMDGAGQLIKGGVGGAPVKLSHPGAAGKYVASTSTDAVWSDFSDDAAAVAVASVINGSGLSATLGFGPDTITLAIIPEWVQDLIAAMFTGGTHSGVTVAYDDPGGFVNLTATGGGATNLNALTDVDTSGGTANNDVLTYLSAFGVWRPVPRWTMAGIPDVQLTSVADGDVLTWNLSLSKWVNQQPAAPATQYSTLNFVIDGGGSTITTGIKGDLVVDFNGTIVGATLLANQSGSIVVDIWKDTYANFPPVVGDSITASSKPTISSGIKSQDATLTGWTTSVTAGDILRFNVDSVATIQRATIALKVVRS